MRKYIVSGTFNEYRNYIAEKGYSPQEYTYVSHPDSIRGLSEIDGFYIGTYEQRPDIDQIRENIAYIKSRSKTYKASASQVLPTGSAPKTVMVKGTSGDWQAFSIPPSIGEMRVNITTNEIEYYNGTDWVTQ